MRCGIGSCIRSGRWLSRDPLEEAVGPNLSGYVENSPPQSVDPEGLLSHERCEELRKRAEVDDPNVRRVINALRNKKEL